jgi:hypothetical protein
MLSGVGERIAEVRVGAERYTVVEAPPGVYMRADCVIWYASQQIVIRFGLTDWQQEACWRKAREMIADDVERECRPSPPWDGRCFPTI